MNNYKYDLGIIGGMGPEATVEIYKRIVASTEANCDQDHLKICILNRSDIPDRTTAILNNDDKPLLYINEAIDDLIKLKTKSFIVACNTAHYFEDRFIGRDKITFYSLIGETLKYLSNKYNNEYSIYVLCTNGTKKAKVYENNIEKKNLNVLYPNDFYQEIVMKAIIDTKAGKNKNEILNTLVDTIKFISKNDTKKCVFVLACTELSIYKDSLNKYGIIVDAMDVLVKKVICELK